MTRRCWLLWAAAAPLPADSAQPVWDVLATAASSLGLGNASAFLAAFDPATAGLAELRTNVQALLAVWNVQSSIELVENGGTEEQPLLELDWLLQLTMRTDAARGVRSRHRVRCRFVNRGKGWRIIEFSPLEMFQPPRIAG